MFEELEPELVRISLRSKDKNVNVSDIAGIFGGGGHQAAAGARITGKAAQLMNKNNEKYALATMCIGGGQGIATILEKM